ncbi:MAG: sugar kinase [Pseudomonadota bacterium]
MPPPDLLALGEPLIEMVRLPDPVDGRPAFRQSVGGDALNALVAAARQGARTGLLSSVGADPFGREILDLCAREGVDGSHISVRDQGQTGVNFVYPDPAGRRFQYARKGSAASCYAPSDLPEGAIAAARILHVTAVSQAISASMRAAVDRAAQVARAQDTWVSYDLNLRLSLWDLEVARRCITGFLPRADILLPSQDEAETLLGPRGATEFLDYFEGFGARFVVLKRGSLGAILSGPDGRTEIPAVAVDALDSTGAGDSLAGAFLAYVLEGVEARDAARRAVSVAAGTVSGFGAIDPIPHRAQIVRP